MIRWYDYFAAVLFADFIQGSFFRGLDALTNPELSIWMAPISLLAAYGWYAWLWMDVYVPFRVRQEHARD